MIGKTLSHYEITGQLGKGGMGEVFRARDSKLGREVALKILPAEMAADAGRLARFEREARTVAGLNHPNIVTLFSVEDTEGIHYLTMELVAGESLEHHLAQEGLPVDQVVELGIAVSDALTAAHVSGVVHRDLKPGNVMLTPEGQVKVLDFGLAKLEQPDSDLGVADAATIAAPLSSPGQIMGTAPYMAPEQVRGETVDSRTDIFSLGVLLYEMTTGRRPFAGGTFGVVSTAILRDPPALPSTVRANVPGALERIILRCLEKDAEDRYQTAREVGRDLRRVGNDPPSDKILVVPPTPSTPLIGREDDLAHAAAKLREGARVLTVSGYGGTGKTRFSIELFHRLVPGYEAGGAFVSLASVTVPAEVLPMVSSSLGIAEAHGRSALEAMCTVIGERHLLLVLDNLEQVLDAAEDIAALIARCSGLQVVATSRAPLKIGAESEFALPPLELPHRNEHALSRLQECPSIALFVQRAVKVNPDFQLTETNAEAVAEVCRRLDGLPLALELAAARVRILEPARLLQRLDNALDLLSSGDRDLPLRQRTLRATISWSYSLLEPPEQQLLRRCSAFQEGWTFEAMEQVCYGVDDRWRALDELESLVEKGLVRVVDSGRRYGLLETVRAFSAEQLHAGGEVGLVRDAHADFFVEFTAEMAHEFRGVGQVRATRRIREDNANELAAIHWLIAAAHGGNEAALEKALLLCGQLDWFWHVAGQHNSARELLDDVLELAKDRPPSRGRALSLLAAGMISTVTGEWERCLQEWTSGREDGTALGEDEIAAEGYMGMAYVHLNCGRLDEAREPIASAIALSSKAGHDFMHSLSLVLKGMLLFQAGDLAAGMETVAEGLRIQKRQGDCEGGGIGLSFLAQMNFAKGDLSRARELYAESLAAFEEIGDRPEIARVHCETGWTELADADPSAAQRSFRSAVNAYEEVGSPRGTGLALLGLAAVEEAAGRSARAVTIAGAAQALADRAGVVCDHPMDPGVFERIEALKVAIPRQTGDGLDENTKELSPAAVLAMVAEPVADDASGGPDGGQESEP